MSIMEVVEEVGNAAVVAEGGREGEQGGRELEVAVRKVLLLLGRTVADSSKPVEFHWEEHTHSISGCSSPSRLYINGRRR